MAQPASTAFASKAGRWVAAAVCLAVGAAAGAGAYSVLPRSYTAETSVLVLPTAVGQDSSTSARNTGAQIAIETEAQVAHSERVAVAAAKDGALAGKVTAADLVDSSTVTFPSNSTVLVFAFSDADPKLAQAGAGALAKAYLAQRQESAKTETDAVSKSLTDQLTDLNAKLNDNANQLQATPTTDTGKRALLEAQRNVLVTQISDLNSRLVAVQSGLGSGGEVLSQAALPSTPSAPKLWVTIGAGLLAGLLAAAALLLGLDQRDRRLASAARRSAAVRRLGPLEVPPVDAPLESPGAARLCAAIDGFSAETGPIVLVGVGDRTLFARAALLLNSAWAHDRGESVLVRAVPNDEAGQVQAGLAELIRGEAPTEAVVRRDVGTAYSQVTPGNGRTSLAPAALRSRLTTIWQDLARRHGDVVVVLDPPLDTVEATSVLRTAGRIVVLSTQEALHSDELDGVFEDIDFLGLAGRIVGTVTMKPGKAAPGASVPAAEAKKAADKATTPTAEVGRTWKPVVPAEPTTPDLSTAASAKVPGYAPRSTVSQGGRHK